MRRRATTLAIALTIAILGVCLSEPTKAQLVEGAGPIHGLQGKCVDVFGADPADGTPVVLYTCSGNPNQRWSIDFAPGDPGIGGNQVMGLGGKCLVPQDPSAPDLTPLVLGPCNPAWRTNPTWFVEAGPLHRFVHKASGKCMDVLMSSPADGTPIVLFPCTGNANQAFAFAFEVALSEQAPGFFEGQLYATALAGWRYAYFDVPPGASILSIQTTGAAELDLYVRRAAKPTLQAFDCRGGEIGFGLERCQVTSPAAGRWWIGLRHLGGSSDPYVTVTANLAYATSCIPSPSNLCLRQSRFNVEASYATVQGGGRSGVAQAVQLESTGISQGGLLWFFDRRNPEVLVKVLDGCAQNGHYWIFLAATTNVGFTVTVTDTVTDGAWSYTNPDQMRAEPVQDTMALPCSL